jgi:hypothetical protein
VVPLAGIEHRLPAVRFVAADDERQSRRVLRLGLLHRAEGDLRGTDVRRRLRAVGVVNEHPAAEREVAFDIAAFEVAAGRGSERAGGE